MKFLLIGTLALMSFSAFACLKNENMNICPGDKAVVDHADGKVVGINPSTKKVSINFDSGTSSVRGIGTYSANRVTVGKGCLEKYCVGDKAVVNYADGKIIGINSVTRKISIDFNSGTSSVRGIDTYSIDNVTIGKGCLEGYCVGDKAVVNYADGKIIGINSKTRKISIDFNSGTSSVRGIDTYNIDNVTIGKGCLAGYCVGDTAIVDYADGKIIGINPSTRKISINFDSGTSSARGIGTYDINRVSVSSYCLEFDADHSARNIQDQSDFGALFQK